MNRKILLVLIIFFSLIGVSFTFICKPSKQFNKIVISEEEWNSIINSREEGNLSIQSLKFNDYDLVVDEKSHKVYYSLIDNSTSKFFPSISYTANTPNTKIAILDDEITEDKIMNNHEFKVLLYDNNSYKEYGLYCTIFPMLNIVYDEPDNTNKRNIDMSIYLFNNFDNGVNRVVKSDGTINKVEMEDGTYNYRFSLVMTTPGNKERENVISLLHMRPNNEYYLNAINVGENNSPIRDKIEKTEDLKEKPDFLQSEKNPKEENLNEKNEQSVELFINNEYVGLYSLGYNPSTRVRPRNK